MRNMRIAYLDFVKLLTIYLVILGHVIAMVGNGNAVGDRLYAFIYSFHVPLFILMSGYFISNQSMSRPFPDLIISKSRQLLLPAITCTVICCLYLFLFRGEVNYRDEIIGNSWFLKTLFVYNVLFYLLKQLQISDFLLFVVSCFALFVIPHATTLQINLLWPYFIVGFLLRKHIILNEIAGSWLATLSFLLLFAGCYSLQQYLDIPNYIPINIDTLQGQWHLILFRYIVGFSGCMCVISLLSLVDRYIGHKKKYLQIADFGKCTLGIYVLQTILVINVFPDVYAWHMESGLLLDVVVAPLLSLAFLSLCLWLIHIFSKSRKLDLLLFGGQYYKR